MIIPPPPTRNSYDLNEIHLQKLRLLTGVCSREAWLAEMTRKLVDYRAVLHVDQLNVGSYVRYIKIAGGSDGDGVLVVGGILVGVFEVGGAEGGGGGAVDYYVQLKSVGLQKRVWNASFRDCVFFQKFSWKINDKIVIDSLRFLKQEEEERAGGFARQLS